MNPASLPVSLLYPRSMFLTREKGLSGAVRAPYQKQALGVQVDPCVGTTAAGGVLGTATHMG